MKYFIVFLLHLVSLMSLSSSYHLGKQHPTLQSSLQNLHTSPSSSQSVMDDSTFMHSRQTSTVYQDGPAFSESFPPGVFSSAFNTHGVRKDGESNRVSTIIYEDSLVRSSLSSISATSSFSFSYETSTHYSHSEMSSHSSMPNFNIVFQSVLPSPFYNQPEKQKLESSFHMISSYSESHLDISISSTPVTWESSPNSLLQEIVQPTQLGNKSEHATITNISDVKTGLTEETKTISPLQEITRTSNNIDFLQRSSMVMRTLSRESTSTILPYKPSDTSISSNKPSTSNAPHILVTQTEKRTNNTIITSNTNKTHKLSDYASTHTKFHGNSTSTTLNTTNTPTTINTNTSSSTSNTTNTFTTANTTNSFKTRRTTDTTNSPNTKNTTTLPNATNKPTKYTIQHKLVSLSNMSILSSESSGISSITAPSSFVSSTLTSTTQDRSKMISTLSQHTTPQQLIPPSVSNPIEEINQTNQLNQNITASISLNLVNNSSVVNNISNIISVLNSTILPSTNYEESHLSPLNVTRQPFLPIPDTDNTILNSISNSNISQDRIHIHKPECNCSFASTNELEAFVRKFLPRRKTVKTFSSMIRINEDNFVPRKSSSNPTSTDSNTVRGSTNEDNDPNSGVVCYDDRMAIASPEVECPKPTSRKLALNDQHLQQLLKNGGGTSPHQFVRPEDVQDVDLNTFNHEVHSREKFTDQLKTLLDEQISFYQNIRHLISEYLVSPTIRSIISLTTFLKRYVEKTIHENGSDSWPDVDLYLFCKLEDLDTASLTSVYDQLERKMLQTETPHQSNSNLEEDLFENIQHYNYQSAILMRLKNNLTSEILQVNHTFEVDWNKWRQAPLDLANNDVTTTNKKSYFTTSPEGSFKSKRKTFPETTTNEQIHPYNTHDCTRIKSDFETNSGYGHSTIQSPFQKSNLGSNFKNIFGVSSQLNGKYGLILSEMFAEISSLLANFAIPKPSTNLTQNVLKDIDNQASLLKRTFLDLLQSKRTKRSVTGISGDACHDQGSRIPNTDFLLMCSMCVTTTTLGTEYFPRHITEKVCKNNGSANAQSGSVSVQDGCLNEGGRAGGFCQQQTMTILLLRRNVGKCMKIISRGREFITDQWKLVAYPLRTGCECVVDKNSQFAKYLTFG